MKIAMKIAVCWDLSQHTKTLDKHPPFCCLFGYPFSGARKRKRAAFVECFVVLLSSTAAQSPHLPFCSCSRNIGKLAPVVVATVNSTPTTPPPLSHKLFPY